MVEGKGIARDILALLVYARGDNTNNEFNDFLGRYMKWIQDVDDAVTAAVDTVRGGGRGDGDGGGESCVDSSSGRADASSGDGGAVASHDLLTDHSASDTLSAHGEVGGEVEKQIVSGGSRSRAAVYPVP